MPEFVKPRHSSYHQDLAVALCVRSYGACPFGCAKDGAHNCQAWVVLSRCEPGRKTALLASELEANRPPIASKAYVKGIPAADYRTAMNEALAMGGPHA